MVKEPNKTDSIFWSALRIAAPEERYRYLDEACADDLDFRAQLDELLAAYPKVERFLEQPAVADVTAIHEPAISEKPGTIIGPIQGFDTGEWRRCGPDFSTHRRLMVASLIHKWYRWS